MSWLIGLALAGWEPEGPDAIATYNEAVDALNAEDPAAAEALLRELLEQQDCGSCQLLLSVSVRRQNRADEALALARETVQAHDVEAAWTELSTSAFAAQDFELATQAAENALKLDPGSGPALSALALAHIRTGDYEALDKALKKAEKKQDPARVACHRVVLEVQRGDVEAAEAAFDRCRSCREEHLVTRARGELEGVGEQGKNATGPYLSIVGALSIGDYPRAEELARVQVAQDDADLYAWMYLAQALFMQERWAEAAEALERVFGGEEWVEVEASGTFQGVLTKNSELLLQEQTTRAGVLLVLVQVQDGRLEQADATLAALKADRGEPPMVLAAGASLALAQGDTAGANALLLRALAEDPEDWFVRWVAGRMARQAPGLVTPELSALMAETRWQDAFNLAVGHFNDGRPEQCLSTLASTTPEGEGVELVANLRYSCAVGAKDLELADSAREGLQSPNPGTVYNHAVLARQAQRDERALELLAGAEPTPEIERIWADLEVHLLVQTGQLDRAVVLAAPASPLTRMNLAIELQIAGKEAEALQLLEGACPELEGPPATECLDMLGALEP